MSSIAIDIFFNGVILLKKLICGLREVILLKNVYVYENSREAFLVLVLYVSYQELISVLNRSGTLLSRVEEISFRLTFASFLFDFAS